MVDGGAETAQLALVGDAYRIVGHETRLQEVLEIVPAPRYERLIRFVFIGIGVVERRRAADVEFVAPHGIVQEIFATRAGAVLGLHVGKCQKSHIGHQTAVDADIESLLLCFLGRHHDSAGTALGAVERRGRSAFQHVDRLDVVGHQLRKGHILVRHAVDHQQRRFSADTQRRSRSELRAVTHLKTGDLARESRSDKGSLHRSQLVAGNFLYGISQRFLLAFHTEGGYNHRINQLGIFLQTDIQLRSACYGDFDRFHTDK